MEKKDAVMDLFLMFIAVLITISLSLGILGFGIVEGIYIVFIIVGVLFVSFGLVLKKRCKKGTSPIYRVEDGKENQSWFR